MPICGYSIAVAVLTAQQLPLPVQDWVLLSPSPPIRNYRQLMVAGVGGEVLSLQYSIWLVAQTPVNNVRSLM